MNSLLKVSHRSLQQRGFVTFTKLDAMVEEFIEDCKNNDIKVRVEKYKSFVVVVVKK